MNSAKTAAPRPRARRLFRVVAAAFLALNFGGAEILAEGEYPPRAPSTEPLRIENYADGDVQRYPVALLRGAAPGADVGTVVVENLSSARPTRISRGSVSGGRFKILVELVPGSNRLSVAVGASRIDISLFYRPKKTKYFVRLIYFVDSTGDETFEIPAFWRDADLLAPAFSLSIDYREKLRTAALLWQTATAERLNDAGFGRRTFALETDPDGEIVLSIQRGKRSAVEYRALSEGELFREIYREIENAPETTKFVRSFVLVAFARRGDAGGAAENGKCRSRGSVEETGASNGRIALGGGSVAILDATTLFAWPDSIDDAERLFSDSRAIPEAFASDSGFRRTRWALSASSLGAGLHELGHSFGLDHSRDENDAMSRGFDRFNRIFTVVEPPSALSSEPIFFDDESATTWGSESAEKLLRSFWIEE